MLNKLSLDDKFDNQI